MEEIEEIDSIIVTELDGPTAKSQRDQITSDHKIASYLVASQGRAQTCVDIYKDEDGLKKAELALMTGPETMTNFYDQLRETKAYHRRFETSAAAQVAPVLQEQLARGSNSASKFSGEESTGRYVDLNGFYQRFVNLPGNRKHAKLDYRSYLDIFADSSAIPLTQKRAKYVAYVGDVSEYLRSFYERCHPLADAGELKTRLEEEFLKSLSNDGLRNKPGYVDLEPFSSHSELEALGLDTLKCGLQALGLKCGGSLGQRAQRLFAAKGMTPEQLLASSSSAGNTGGKKRKRKRRKGGQSGDAGSDGGGTINGNGHGMGGDDEADKALRRKVLRHEFATGFYSTLLANTIKNTKKYVETRLIRTYEELVAQKSAQDEAEALMAADNDDDSDDEEAPTYNPLNLPLGWDGKPIPFWLYKLHGLGVEFKCEICGNESYWGRRSFDRHFQESRHAYGMRCLGIPNTKHFHDITLIEDARALFGKMQASSNRDSWQPEAHEEFEDTDGNVFDKKTYEDLAKQGLL